MKNFQRIVSEKVQIMQFKIVYNYHAIRFVAALTVALSISVTMFADYSKTPNGDYVAAVLVTFVFFSALIGSFLCGLAWMARPIVRYFTLGF